MEQAEQARLAQLGKERRLGEAVAVLEQASSEVIRIQADTNATEDDVLQAGVDYRTAVIRRNAAFDAAQGEATVELGDRASGVVTDPPAPSEDAPINADPEPPKGDPKGEAGADKAGDGS